MAADRPLREALLVWTATVAAMAAAGLAALAVPWIAENLLALVAAAFLYLPAWAVWRRGRDLAEYGLRARPVAQGLVAFAVAALTVLPPHFGLHHLWQRWVYGASLHVERYRLVRFDRDLEGRPEEFAADGGLRAWTERGRLHLVWTGSPEATIHLRLTPPAARGLAGFRVEGGAIRPAGRPRTTVRHDGRIAWRPRAPGDGLRLDVRRVEALHIESPAPLRLGRYGVRASAPYETHRSPWWPLWAFGLQLLLVALPEEWCFRGYLQGRLDEAWRPRWRILGADLGPGWLLAAALFALGHLVLDPRPVRLAVFFPGLLFGYLRARTGSILAGTCLHAASNVWIRALGYLYAP